ncbi:MAG: hypothetical protein Q6366_012640 [Candidatus Freyarchaeota archaeon]
MGKYEYYDCMVINLEAVIGIIFSVTEAYPKETVGVLFGYPDELNNEYVCTGASPIQTAERKATEVEWEISKENRICKMGRLLGRGEPTGNFHSHSYPKNQALDTDPWISKEDYEIWMLSGYPVEAVIGVKMYREKPQRQEPAWKILDRPKNLLKARIDRFELRLNFFTLIEGKPEKLEIYCLAINGLNYLWYTYGISLQDLVDYSPKDRYTIIEKIKEISKADQEIEGIIIKNYD